MLFVFKRNKIFPKPHFHGGRTLVTLASIVTKVKKYRSIVSVVILVILPEVIKIKPTKCEKTKKRVRKWTQRRRALATSQMLRMEFAVENPGNLRIFTNEREDVKTING